MNTARTLRRISDALTRPTYLVPTLQVDARYRERLARLASWMATPGFDGELAMAMVRRWREEGELDEERMWSAMAVICTHPSVRLFREASRCIALQENAALERGGEGLDAALASVERHRGVLAFCMGQPGVALEYFIRALERERTAENLGNVLAALVREGELDQASDLLAHVRGQLSGGISEALDQLVAVDDDLAPLRG